MVAGEEEELGSGALRLRWPLKTISRPPLEWDGQRCFECGGMAGSE